MAAILRLFGRERRHGNGAWSVGRRSTDRETFVRRMSQARVDEVERRLRNYDQVRFPR